MMFIGINLNADELDIFHIQTPLFFLYNLGASIQRIY